MYSISKKTNSSVMCVAFSPDGTQILFGCVDGSVQLWDILGDRKSKWLEGHTKYVQSVAFSPDGKWIVSGSSDQSV